MGQGLWWHRTGSQYALEQVKCCEKWWNQVGLSVLPGVLSFSLDSPFFPPQKPLAQQGVYLCGDPAELIVNPAQANLPRTHSHSFNILKCGSDHHSCHQVEVFQNQKILQRQSHPDFQSQILALASDRASFAQGSGMSQSQHQKPPFCHIFLPCSQWTLSFPCSSHSLLAKLSVSK